MEALKAAVAGGCDAIYLGMKAFSARAFAGNFDHDEFREAIRYCHARDVKIYVTMNTIMFETEIENALKEVRFLYENDVDALLIQDFGLFHLVRTCFPDLDIHCSTQMHIHNLAGVREMQREGAARVVLARETPVELIRKACETGMEIEVFAYGAICISYSGQCLMSASLKNRSANRGMCAQCCRLLYYPSNKGHFREGDYILSPKDLNTLDRLPELLEAGVSSLKIEGRMKRPEYVYLVTKTFREAIDAYYEGREYHVSESRMHDLLLMFNRGFSEGHLFHDEVNDRMSQYRPNHRGIRIGEITAVKNSQITVKLEEPLYQHDGLRIIQDPQDIGLTAVKIWKKDKLVSEAMPGDVVRLGFHPKDHPKAGQALHKTSDARLLESIRNIIESEPRQADVSMRYEARVNEPFRVTVKDEDGREASAQSSQLCQQAEKAPLTEEKIRRSLEKTGDLPYRIASLSGESGEVFLPVSVMNETRRAALQSLHEMREVRHERKGELPYAFAVQEKEEPPYRLIIEDHTGNQYGDEEIMVVSEENGTLMPVIHENDDSKDVIMHSVISQAGDLWHDPEHVIAGMTLNIANSYAIAHFLSKPGIDAVIFSSEISETMIGMTLEAFQKRYGFTPVTYRLVYGKRTLMYIKDGFMKNRSVHYMRDLHGQIFKIDYNNQLTEIEEPEPFRSGNRFCYGSYLILRDGEDAEDIKGEAYEELHERIQSIRTQG